MKTLVRLALLPLVVVAARAVDFHDHLGMQLYSMRAQLKDNVPAALDLVKGYGTTEVETYDGIPNITVEKLSAELKARGLKVLSAHMSYASCKKDINVVIRDAKTLGAQMIVVPYLQHAKEGMTEAEAHAIAADFNAFGAACKAAGLKFGYHPHGFEFVPTKPGSKELVFDVLARETKPELVNFEMDVFWVFHAGQDPVALLNKYPNRWVALHVKDIRKGALTARSPDTAGLVLASAPPTDKVVVGTGQIDWPSVLRAAQKLGIDKYFIEDESPAPLQVIPESLKYLRALKL